MLMNVISHKKKKQSLERLLPAIQPPSSVAFLLPFYTFFLQYDLALVCKNSLQFSFPASILLGKDENKSLMQFSHRFQTVALLKQQFLLLQMGPFFRTASSAFSISNNHRFGSMDRLHTVFNTILRAFFLNFFDCKIASKKNLFQIPNNIWHAPSQVFFLSQKLTKHCIHFVFVLRFIESGSF